MQSFQHHINATVLKLKTSQWSVFKSMPVRNRRQSMISGINSIILILKSPFFLKFAFTIWGDIHSVYQAHLAAHLHLTTAFAKEATEKQAYCDPGQSKVSNWFRPWHGLSVCLLLDHKDPYIFFGWFIWMRNFEKPVRRKAPLVGFFCGQVRFRWVLINYHKTGRADIRTSIWPQSFHDRLIGEHVGL